MRKLTHLQVCILKSLKTSQKSFVVFFPHVSYILLYLSLLPVILFFVVVTIIDYLNFRILKLEDYRVQHFDFADEEIGP